MADGLPIEELLRREQIFKQNERNYASAAREIGIAPATLRGSLDRLDRERKTGKIAEATERLECPEFPDDDIPVEQIIETLEKRFSKRQAHKDAKKWFPVRVNIDGPFGILWYGDPHLDDDGCNWTLLRKHISLHESCPALFAANLGDTTNNWVGRLMRLYAEQETSKHTARKLAKWFLLEANIPWFIWIFGNHDLWNDGDALLRALNVNRIIMEDRAQFRLLSGDKEWRVWVEHDFKGNSIWNSLHGPQRAAHTKEMAHLYICGHKHNWALHQEESASRGFIYWLARARGYKFIDSFGESLGHFPQKEGASILSVHDPDATSMAGFMQCFADPEEGVDYLNWKRGRK